MTSPAHSPTPETVKLPNEIKEVSLTLVIAQLDPSMLTEQFLKFSGIIPNDWELARQPVVGKAGTQLVFKNGVSLVAQPQSVTFLEGINDKGIEAIAIAQIAQTFLDKLPNADYQGVTISPKTLIPLPDQADGARKFISGTLLAPGPWQDFGKSPVQASIDLLYQFEGCQLTLKVNQAVLQIPDRQPVSALLFSGNFNYRLNNPNPKERIQVATQYLAAWQSDLETFLGIVHERFLSQKQPETVFG
jgi:hypothetical protein